MVDTMNARNTQFTKAFHALKQNAGSHSPSMEDLKKMFPTLEIKIDACYLSNPYASELVLDYIDRELIQTNAYKKVLTHYPSQQRSLQKVMAESLHVKPENIFIGNGATEIIQMLLQQEEVQKVALMIPTFSSYYEFVGKGCEVVYFPLNERDDYSFDADKYCQFIENEQPDTVVLINPNNPNGAYLSLEKMHILLKRLAFVPRIIIDESFIHFAYEDEALTCLSSTVLFDMYPNVIIVKSLSKDFGIAGVRLGYALMDSRKIDALLEHGFLWNINGIGEYCLRLFVREDFLKRYEEARKQYIKEMCRFKEALLGIENVYVYPSMANFVMLKLPSRIKASFVISALLVEYGIYVRTMADKIGVEGECIRIAGRTREENNCIVMALKSILKDSK
ncbi:MULTISPECIES: norcobamide biosynthesis serine-O-phosphate decarboxylase [Sulfurospirillum]|uniref:L-serine phosphate decarboxylase n=3 Tax=Sulfurospirillum TaxID=57665 RepID=S1544_SULMK|nr:MULTISPECIES: norcobamide biosynthesis serine-O-phosphate decarboxylase [Sulfurospirillum]P0DV65.1 RecName: Full=L-serine phosphate decarboxylase; AltName: Full=CobD homolog SMUL_1544; Short=SmCobD; AltName: Full=L-serine O-phosphate decarboxylase; Short=L-Ser-P decarboxylase; AltName: Full=Norcobamide biosynthesis protein SMUL_1544; AltName: Full=Threonine phosphate decarboxylase-like enzyme [Sulfurospirillum multivorans DSM 12446]AHJ12804.1 threonine phosphate decarboxylase-like enzyme [Sulf